MLRRIDSSKSIETNPRGARKPRCRGYLQSMHLTGRPPIQRLRSAGWGRENTIPDPC